jgi:gas vesicle protein
MMRNFGRFILGLVTGAVFGGVLALLFAPSSGDETRARVQESYTHIRNEVKEAASAKAEGLKTELARLQKKIIPE